MIVYILKSNNSLTKNVNRICNYEHKNCNFSKSHSGIYTVIAVSKHAKIGIDVEKAVERSERTIEYFFSKYKSFNIVGYKKEELFSFYRSWTAMESYFKFSKKGFYTDKNFTLDLSGKRILTERKQLFITYLNYRNYMICICTDEEEEISNVQIVDDIGG